MGVKYLIEILSFCILYALRILNLLKRGFFSRYSGLIPKAPFLVQCSVDIYSQNLPAIKIAEIDILQRDNEFDKL